MRPATRRDGRQGILKAELERYAAMHSQAYGEPVEAVTLIPYMLETFMARDRGFKPTRSLHIQVQKS